MNEGVIYYNKGMKMLVRLIVSLHSLRKVYDKNVAILIEGEESDECKEIANMYNAQIVDVDFGESYKNKTYLNSCLSHTVTPYDTSIWIDSDTVILKDPSKLFEHARKNEFAIAQFANWVTNGSKIRKRIKAWEPYLPEFVKDAINFGPAINCGVYAFHKDGKLVKDWFDHAVKGKTSFIPDEVCCQVILPQYPHIIVDPKYNTSCRYGTVDKNTVIIHYHGRKHCRIKDGKYLNNSKLWFNEYNEIKDLDIIKSLVKKDRQLRINLKIFEKLNK